MKVKTVKKLWRRTALYKQTDVTKHELASKIENMILRNELQSGLSSAPRVISNLSYEVVVNHPDQMKHFVGLTSSQFEILHEFLNDVCPLETISYWDCKDRSLSSPCAIQTD